MPESKRMDGYVRVSRVGKRTGASFISPEEQRDKIAAWARSRDIEIDEWHEDLDQSGGKLKRPGLDAALKRIEQGRSEGIVVAKLDRLSRAGVGDALKLIERIMEQGGSVAAVDVGIDPTTPMGHFALTVMLALAKMERDRISESWSDATSRAVADGVHISSRPPTGYVRNGKRSKLVPDPDVAPLVRQAFRLRARGTSWQKIADFMTLNGCPVSKTAVGHMIQNPVYLGHARGSAVGAPNEKAHEAIVTPQEWEEAQIVGKAHAKDGSIASQGLVAGLITCAGCGHKLSVFAGTVKNKDGTTSRVPSYACKKRYRDFVCPAPASARLRTVDAAVENALGIAVHDGTLSATLDVITRYREAEEAVEKAEADLRDLQGRVDLVSSLGVAGFANLAADQRTVVEEAKRALRTTPAPDSAIQPDLRFWDADPEPWPMVEKRRMTKQFVKEVTLARGGKSRWSAPPWQRMEITWQGHDDPDTAVMEKVSELLEGPLSPVRTGRAR